MRVSEIRGVAWILTLLLVLGTAVDGHADNEALRAAIEQRFRVEAAPGGVTLKPHTSLDGVTSVRIEGPEIHVNEAKVHRVVLEAWLPQDAPRLLQLAALSGPEQRALFGLATSGLVATPEPFVKPISPPVVASPVVEREAGEPVEAPEPPEAPTPPEPVPPLEAPAPEERRNTGGQFTLFDDLRVSGDESARDAVAVFGSVTVEGEVRSDVTAVLGSVYVDGEVGGEVVAVNGSVHLGPQAHVAGNVTSVGGVVERAEGARIDGAETQVPLGSWSWRDKEGRGRTWRGPLSGWWWSNPVAGLISLFWRLMVLGFVVLVLCLTLLLAPGPVERAERRIEAGPLKAGLVGFLGVAVTVPAFVLALIVLVITILGIALIPLLVVAVPLVALVATLLGYTAACLWVGKLANKRLRWDLKSTFSRLLLGFAVLELVELAGGSLQAIGGLLNPVGWAVAQVGDLIQLAAFFVGLGGVILVRYGRYFDGQTGTAIPIPNAPPVAPPAA